MVKLLRLFLDNKLLAQINIYRQACLNKQASKSIDLSNIKDLSYSAILRELNANYPQSVITDFLSYFKESFDTLLLNDLDNDKALDLALKLFQSKYHVKLNDNKFNKQAQNHYYGDPILVGKYISDIIKFTLNRISPKRRSKSIRSLINKIMKMNMRELSDKQLPPSAAIGQSITFLKHVLFGQDLTYIRNVLSSVVKYLGT